MKVGRGSTPRTLWRSYSPAAYCACEPRASRRRVYFSDLPPPTARGRLCALRFPIAVCFRVASHAVASLHTRLRFSLSETASSFSSCPPSCYRLLVPLELMTGTEEVPLFHGWRVEPANDNSLTRAARHFSPHARLPGSCVVGVWFDQVHGPNKKSTRIVDTPHMVSSSVRGTLVVRVQHTRCWHPVEAVVKDSACGSLVL